MLIANRMTPESRRATGRALVAVGAVTTFPLAAEVIFGRKATQQTGRRERTAPAEPADVEQTERLPAVEL